MLRPIPSSPGANAAELGPRDRAVQLKRAAPERLAAKRIEPERLPSLIEHRLRVLTNCLVESGPRSACVGHRRRVSPTVVQEPATDPTMTHAGKNLKKRLGDDPMSVSFRDD
jgi:hypothetical protein